MAALREMVSPRQASSHFNWVGAKRSGIGRAKGMCAAGWLDNGIRLVYGVKALNQSAWAQQPRLINGYGTSLAIGKAQFPRL
jgi:hypothetical protein